MSTEQFNAKRDQIVQWLNKKEKNFTFVQKGVQNHIHASAVIISSEDFISEIEIKGNDSVGKWNAKGFILCQNQNQVFMWYYKQYEKRVQAGQIGDWEHLIYKSVSYQSGRLMVGKWYYQGFENSSEYSGRWSLKYSEKQPEFGFNLDQETMPIDSETIQSFTKEELNKI